jgi:phosphoglycerol transferase MdoB-like AlkP superfamily enzyme
MKIILKSFLKQIVFWFLLFTLARIIFLLFYLSFLKDIDFINIIALFWHAVRLDISTISFILLLPFLLLGSNLFIQRKWPVVIVKYYHFIIIVFYSIITTAENGIYGDWLTKLNVKAINYLSHPSEIYNSSATGTFFLLLLVLILQSVAGCLAYSRWFHEKQFEKISLLKSFLFIVVGAFLLVLGLRGGIQQVPVNQSSVYFSKRNILNQTAVNPAWNIFHSIHQNYYSIQGNPFVYYSDKEAEKIVTELFHVEKDTTEIILNNQRPNIVFVILEGWSSSVIGSLGGEKGVTPRFDSLTKKGFLFTQCYAPGNRSEQGMACIFSAFPATPLSTITRQPDKFAKLSYLTHRFIKRGYYTSYFFGGQLDYGNMKGYIYENHFEKITEEKDFPSSFVRGKLSVPDENLYQQVLSELKTDDQPFYSALFTASTHTPYDYPNTISKFKFEGETEYANSMYYADSCLNDFLLKAQSEEWFKNTLFVIVSDHGHSGVKPIDDFLPGLQKIPFLLYGDVIKEEYRGKTFGEPVSQLDIASTLLHQMHEDSREFRWSQDLFNPYRKSFAYYAFEVGCALVTNEGYFIYKEDLNKVLYCTLPKSKEDSIVKTGKSYLQVLYQEYFDY